jgi:uncharacterized protein
VLPPAPSARVNDYAGLLPPGERAALEQLLAEGERQPGVQMVVAVFPSLEGEDLEAVSLRLAERWRIGQRGLDNGVVLVVFVRERRVRLEVGYGLEPVLPDAVAARIIREELAPRFREGRYADGLAAAARAVFRALEAEPRAAPAGDRRPRPRAVPASRDGPGWPALALGAVLLVAFLALTLMTLGDRPGAWTLGSRRRRMRRAVFPAPGFGWPDPPSGGGTAGGGFAGGGGRFGGGGASGSW